MKPNYSPPLINTHGDILLHFKIEKNLSNQG
jgi:hypothetical protein